MSESVTHECPFPECDWTHEYTHLEDGQVIDDLPTARHYEKQHGGRIRLQVTIEYEQVLGGRTPREVRQHAFERWAEKPHDVAHVRSEVLEPADDHGVLGDG